MIPYLQLIETIIVVAYCSRTVTVYYADRNYYIPLISGSASATRIMVISRSAREAWPYRWLKRTAADPRGGWFYSARAKTFDIDDIIDDRYIVRGICSEAGGMGALLFVDHISDPKSLVQVLKYCKQPNDEATKRFRREVRLMKQFKGNSRVMQIRYSNLDHDPPYFVMRYFPDGDLTKIADSIRVDLNRQEAIVNQMLDCVAELHAQGVFHRDIKPQNFLLCDGEVVVSDLGLSAEFDSSTMFTRSSMFWGTPGYLPPEFSTPGGFKNADPSGDIFMLGKTFYFLLCGREPTYLLADNIPGPLFAVIERCCALPKANRYQDLASLRQSLTAAYDVLLGRAVGSALASRTLRSVMDRLKASNEYQPMEVKKFIEELSMLSEVDKIQNCLELPDELFPVLSQRSVGSHLAQFLASYRLMVEEGSYGWSYAETIANRMRIFFDGPEVSATNKAEALRIAIIASDRKNRFAAMDTCRAMITSVVDEELGQRVHDVIMDLPHQFILSIEEANCHSPAVRSAIAKHHADNGSDL